MKIEFDGIQNLNGVGRITYAVTQENQSELNIIEGEFSDGQVNGWNRWICCLTRASNTEMINSFVYEGILRDRKSTKYIIAPHENSKMMP